jgi:DNA repair protein RecO (recombination protein O)
MTHLEPAFILHRYPYQEHGLLLKLFSPQTGFYTAVAKGVKKAKSPWAGILQPFSPLLVKTRGRGEVLSLQTAEAAGKPFSYEQSSLLSAFYLNELLMTFLHSHQEYSTLFSVYHQTLEGLREPRFEGYIRSFELTLLQELGLAPELTIDTEHNTIDSNTQYLLTPGCLPEVVNTHTNGLILSGEYLLAIEQRQWQDKEVLRAAKHLLRSWIQYYAKGKVFKSRELFREGLDNEA